MSKFKHLSAADATAKVETLPEDLHRRIAAKLGWTIKDAQSMSLYDLREQIRPIDAKLTHEIGQVIGRDAHIYRSNPAKRSSLDGWIS